MSELVFLSARQLITSKPNIRFENDTEGDECLWLNWGMNGVCIPKKHIIEHREEFTKLADFIGQILQDHDIGKEGK